MEKEKKDTGRKKGSSNLIYEILNGGIFSNRIVTKNLTFIIYIAALIVIYMAYNYTYDEYAYKLKVNEMTITNLLSDYNSRNAELLRYSRKDTIKAELAKKQSDLVEPTVPPIVLKQQTEPRTSNR